MQNTHIINISKEQFDEIDIGDRLIICNDKDKFSYIVYVKEENKEEDM